MNGLQIVGALFVDLGQQARDGRWIRPPRARYECLRCDGVDGVTGAKDVVEFVATIRATHKTDCTATGGTLDEAA